MGNGGEQLPHRRQPRGTDKLRLGVLQRLLGALALGNVHDRADEFQITAFGAVGLANALHIFDRSIGQNDPVFMLEPAFVAHSLVEGVFERGPVFGLKPRQEGRIAWLRGRGIEVEDMEMLRRPGHRTGGDVPAPTAGAADLLCLGKRGLASPQIFLGTFPVGDVDRGPGKMWWTGRDRGHEGTRIHPDHASILAANAFHNMLRVIGTRGARRDARCGVGAVILMGDVHR